jgi:oxygen-independent coproporphyrinogen-3 oxidase
VHVPFCRTLCPYCDFTIALTDASQVAALGEALLLEAGRRAPGLVPETLYFGGGTPTELPPEILANLARVLSAGAPGVEVTVEANPESVTPEMAGALARAGVGRVSLGVQSADAAMLVALGRGHTAARAREAFQTLREGGIPAINVDLMFGLPGQPLETWKATVEEVLGWEPDHLSAYALELSPTVPMARQLRSGARTALPDESAEEQYLWLIGRARVAGFEHYEISNYARPGRRSRHNEGYWSGRPYVGLGPGAHSFDGRGRRWNVRRYRDYIRRIQAGEDAAEGSESLDANQRLLEHVFLSLRTREGLLFERFPGDFPPGVAAAALRWAGAQDPLWVRASPEGISLTESGFWYSQGLIADLSACLPSALEGGQA